MGDLSVAPGNLDRQEAGPGATAGLVGRLFPINAPQFIAEPVICCQKAGDASWWICCVCRWVQSAQGGQNPTATPSHTSLRWFCPPRPCYVWKRLGGWITISPARMTTRPFLA